ncbi:MAG: hypothetical protein DIZ78_06760 [endosymbiont of Escarpia spicata]|uniref:NfeD-like C-terminal domain-containing protein n=1 Tax=endosymbiont of Escarpia spicata TaxID=2200908 RepID=A0A370DQL5_9GAMM|nr:MAG: hypothetical protein DIZ78_06760 [endosymbiont of Escarpia spicata]
MEFLPQLDYWHWFILGVGLIILEIFSPGVFFIWLGFAAGLVGLLLLAVPEMEWQYQLLAFAAFSVINILIARTILQRRPIKTDQPNLNRRGAQYTDRVFTLDHPIVNGEGKIHVDDSTWKIRGTDCPAGTQVKVIGVEGVVLLVGPAD